MHKSILVTGVAGSGKSAVCKELKRLGYRAHNIEEMPSLFKMIDRKTGKIVRDHNNDDFESVKQHDWICDKKKLQQLIKKNPKEIVFYCGVASKIDILLPLFNKVFLLKVSKKVLRKRLSTRTSNDFGRNPEVQKWIFGWKNWWEGHMREKGAIVIDANRGLREIAADIVERSKPEPCLSKKHRNKKKRTIVNFLYL